MKRILLTTLMLLLLFAVASVTASDTKVSGRVYSSWMLDRTDGAENANEFSLDRAYLTIKSKLSDYTSLRITTDLKETDVDGETRFDIILKYGYVDIKPGFANGKLKLRLGLQPTPYIDYQNKLWGRRYLSKTVSDLNKFLTTSDIGMGISVPFGDKGTVGTLSAVVFNGTSYTDLDEANKYKDINLFLRFNPFYNNENLKGSSISAQFYNGVDNVVIGINEKAGDYKNQIISASGYLLYDGYIDIGADYNRRITRDGAASAEVTSTGLSFFGSIYFERLFESAPGFRTLNLFGRYDKFDPDTDSELDAESLLIFGLECAPTKGIKTSFNYRIADHDNSTIDEKQFYFNTLFKF